MHEESRAGRFAVILHADVAGSTQMVQRDEQLAHERIRDAFVRLGAAIERYSGRVLELRGDALLAEFEKPSNAVSATLAFQADNAGILSALDDELLPDLRIGIAMGEVVVADNTVTGAGVVLAQRVEQLAQAGSVCITAAVREALPGRLPFEFDNLGEQPLKGFAEPVRVYRVSLAGDAAPPEAETRQAQKPTLAMKSWILTGALILMLGAAFAYRLQPWQSSGDPVTAVPPAPELPDRPSIVVLPFVNLYDDGGQDYFADGLANSITTYLSKFRELFVISSTTAVTYKGKSIAAREIGRELGVAYVLEGSVQRAADKLGVHVQLIESANDRHVWAEEYSVAPGELFSLQAEMISEIVGTLSSTLTNEALTQVMKQSPTSLEGYDLYLRAKAITKTYKKENFNRAIGLLNQAIDLSPGLLEAHFELADLHLSAWRFGRSEDENESLRLARHHAARVLEIDQTDYRGHFLQGKLQLFVDHDHDLALLSYGRALDDNPNDTYVLYNMGFLMSLMGKGEECIEWNSRARRVNPRYPGWFNYNAAMGHFLVGDHEKAVLFARAGMAYSPKSLAPRRILIAALVESGRLQDARQEAEKYMAIGPNFRLSTFRNTPWKHRADQDRYYDALRQAGIPD